MPIIRSGYAPPKHLKNAAYGYDTAHWKRTRAARLQLDGHACQLRYPGCTTTATTVDLDDTLKGDHRLASIHNTRSACRHCHGIKDGGGWTGRQFA